MACSWVTSERPDARGAGLDETSRIRPIRRLDSTSWCVLGVGPERVGSIVIAILPAFAGETRRRGEPKLADCFSEAVRIESEG